MEKIIVGMDGSEMAMAALRWAAAHAKPDDVIVAAHGWSIPAAVGFEMPVSSLAAVESAAHSVAAEAVAKVTAEQDDGPRIETHVAHSPPGPLLAQLSADADLVVVGSRGLGGLRSALLGSVSNYVVHHARCPVVVMPPVGAED